MFRYLYTAVFKLNEQNLPLHYSIRHHPAQPISSYICMYMMWPMLNSVADYKRRELTSMGSKSILLPLDGITVTQSF